MLTHTPTAEISLRALIHNYRTLSRDGTALFPTVKADAYGHGALAVSRLLLALGARTLAVANAKEALALAPLFNPRNCNELFTYPSILILGPVSEAALPSLLSLPAIFSVHSLAYAKALSRAAAKLPLPLPIALKAETGMNRLGLSLAEARAILRLPQIFPHTLYTHFGEGGSPSGRTLLQRESFSRFRAMLAEEGVFPVTHISASAAFCRFGAFGESGARIGLALYGVSHAACDLPLLPAMRLLATVLSVKRVRRGAGVGYGSYRAPRDTRVAVLGCGYADGIPLCASGATLFFKGTPVRIVSEVCMDRLLLDVGRVPLGEGETVCLFGSEENPTAAVAEAFGVSPYRLLSVRSPRTERVFVSS